MFCARVVIVAILLLTGIVEGALVHKLPIRKRSYLVARGGKDKVLVRFKKLMTFGTKR